jgi:DNA helicase-2/ATP-dependent DNA helicase PcrA
MSAARARGTSIHKAIADHLRQPQLIPVDLPADTSSLFETFLASRFNRPPVLCEAAFLLDFAPGDVRGRIDSVFARDNSGLEVVDYKSGTARPPEELAENIQLPLYAMAAAQRFRLRLEDMTWTYFYLGDATEVGFAGNQATGTRLVETVERLIDSIQSGEFMSTPGCTCWACTRWPSRVRQT